MRQSPFEIGQRATQMLFDLIEGRSLDPVQVALPTERIVRSSPAPV